MDLVRLTLSGFFLGIEELAMKATDVDDEVAETLALHLPSLTTLDLSHTRVTGVGVKALAEKPGSKLKLLNLNHCRDVGRDAVEYARWRGIDVSYRFPDSKGGRAKRLRT